MSKGFFKKMIMVIFLLIILINATIAAIFFKGAGYKLSWEKSSNQMKIDVTEISMQSSEINYNKINLNTQNGILEVFENIFVKEKHKNGIFKIKLN